MALARSELQEQPRSGKRGNGDTYERCESGSRQHGGLNPLYSLAWDTQPAASKTESMHYDSGRDIVSCPSHLTRLALRGAPRSLPRVGLRRTFQTIGISGSDVQETFDKPRGTIYSPPDGTGGLGGEDVI